MAASTLENTTQPAYALLEKELRDFVLSHPGGDNQAIRPESELAGQYGISRGTVRKALDNLVKEGLLRKVKGSGTFVVPAGERPNARAIDAAKTLKDRQVVFLSFFTALSEGMFRHTFDPVFAGMHGIFDRRGCNLLFAHVGPDWRPPSCLINGDVGGILFHGVPERGFWERHVRPIPHIGLFHTDPSLPCNWVKTDNMDFSFQAVRHLVDLGHRRIGFVSDENDAPIARERFHGYLAAMAHFGLPSEARYQVVWQREAVNGVLLPDAGLPDYGPRLAECMADRASAPTAFVCIDDWRAHGAASALTRMGLRIPADVSLTGQTLVTDASTPFAAPPPTPMAMRFTGLEVDLTAVCAEASRLLLTLRDDPPLPESSMTLAVRPRLRLGESTAPVRTEA